MRFTILKTLIVLILLTIGFTGEAQDDVIPQEKYRVIAVKKGDTSITSLSNEQSIKTPIRLWVPSAFTPNNDGLNDTFGAKGMGIEDYKLEIFNRWGKLVFESDNIQKQWDGNYKGSLAPIDEYVYIVSATGNNGDYKDYISKKGVLFLLK